VTNDHVASARQVTGTVGPGRHARIADPEALVADEWRIERASDTNPLAKARVTSI
jgi:hypothetical protein